MKSESMKENPAKSIKIGIIVLDYNTHDETEECLESLSKVDYSGLDVKIIVIDNGSRDNYKIQITNYKLQIDIIKTEENLGFAGGNNLGIEKALAWGADFIMFLNNDTIVEKSFLAELVNVFSKNKNIGIVVPKIYFAKGFEFHKDKYEKEELGKVIWYAGGIMDWENIIGHHRGVDEVDHGQYDEISETDYATGCCFVVPSEIFEKVGVYDEKYYLYYEEIDLCERLRRYGYKILYVPTSKIWHKNAASSGGSGSALQDYYITRNRLLFGMRYASLRTKISLFKEALRLLSSGRKWQKTGVRDFFRAKLGRGSYQ